MGQARKRRQVVEQWFDEGKGLELERQVLPYTGSNSPFRLLRPIEVRLAYDEDGEVQVAWLEDEDEPMPSSKDWMSAEESLAAFMALEHADDEAIRAFVKKWGWLGLRPAFGLPDGLNGPSIFQEERTLDGRPLEDENECEEEFYLYHWLYEPVCVYRSYARQVTAILTAWQRLRKWKAVPEETIVSAANLFPYDPRLQPVHMTPNGQWKGLQAGEMPKFRLYAGERANQFYLDSVRQSIIDLHIAAIKGFVGSTSSGEAFVSRQRAYLTKIINLWLADSGLAPRMTWGEALQGELVLDADFKANHWDQIRRNYPAPNIDQNYVPLDLPVRPSRLFAALTTQLVAALTTKPVMYQCDECNGIFHAGDFPTIPREDRGNYHSQACSDEARKRRDRDYRRAKRAAEKEAKATQKGNDKPLPAAE